MGKSSKARKTAVPPEEHLVPPIHPRLLEFTTNAPTIIDTHSHISSTYEAYRKAYPNGAHNDVYSFTRAMINGRNVSALVDVFCEAPVLPVWKELANAEEQWGNLRYRFVMGVHPHQARDYTDEVETEILKAMEHPRCVGWGEMGLDYHYDNSPRDIQQEVFARQLRHAVRLNKPLTIHTREAEEDTERILKENVPKEHPIHIHCFTDSPELARRLLDHFPNLCIGITGVITYSTNLNTPNVIRNMVQSNTAEPLRILLETDAPYMVPSSIYASIPAMGSSSRLGKFPLSHAAMIPWTAQFVAQVANEAAGQERWDVAQILEISQRNTKKVYGIE